MTAKEKRSTRNHLVLCRKEAQKYLREALQRMAQAKKLGMRPSRIDLICAVTQRRMINDLNDAIRDAKSI